MIEIFDTQQEYNVYTSYNTCLQSDRLYYIKENGNTHFYTNNIDGEAKIYDNGAVPQGTKSIIENGTNIDVSSYATATVNVPTKENNLIDLIERDITSLEIPAGTTKIGLRAFSGCSYLSSITIPNSITEIGESSLYGCSSLTSIDIPNSVTYIGQNAFYNCSGLTSITISEGVNYIGANAFSGCSNLEEIIVPDSVTTLGGTNIFANCSKLKKLTIGSGLTMDFKFNYSILGSNNMDSNMTLYYNSSYLYYDMFSNSKIKNVYLGPNVSQMRYAFRDCRFTNVTCYATTPPTINSESNIFNNYVTKIYVPSESVDLYKSANHWSFFADKIQAIP